MKTKDEVVVEVPNYSFGLIAKENYFYFYIPDLKLSAKVGTLEEAFGKINNLREKG